MFPFVCDKHKVHAKAYRSYDCLYRQTVFGGKVNAGTVIKLNDRLGEILLIQHDNIGTPSVAE